MGELIALLQRDPNAANAFGALASAVAALLALLVSGISMWISVRTANDQRVHNALTVRPLAEITVANYEDSLRVKVLNNGTGPLILKEIRVSDGESVLPSLIDWMPRLPDDRPWNNYSKNFLDRSLAAGSELSLLELTEGDGESDFHVCRDLVRAALAPLTVNVEYTDIYGVTMKPSCKKLDWFSR